MAAQFCRWDPTLSMTGLRFSNVMEPADYAGFPEFDRDPRTRQWNLWSYVDARDGALAVRLALEAATPGVDVFVIAAADTVMSRSSADLAADVFPDVEVRRGLDEHETLLSIEKARRILGFAPRHSWRDAGIRLAECLAVPAAVSGSGPAAVVRGWSDAAARPPNAAGRPAHPATSVASGRRTRSNCTAQTPCPARIRGSTALATLEGMRKRAIDTAQPMRHQTQSPPTSSSSAPARPDSPWPDRWRARASTSWLSSDTPARRRSRRPPASAPGPWRSSAAGGSTTRSAPVRCASGR